MNQLKPVQFVNVHGEPVNLAQQIAESIRNAVILRSAGIPDKRKPTVKNGYAAPPGTGPEGEICKGCKHKLSMESNSGSKRFVKCELRRATWTHGEGTDIRASSPACSKFEPKEPA
jgi:hypothetical protein